MNRLMAVAVSQKRFRRALLSDPAEALAMGYHGTPFHLAPEEQAQVLSVQASSLQEFAQQLLVQESSAAANTQRAA
ncbi:MAG: hypothetical protein M3220_18385 [Chloroflexota bacterium]|nr:hypothetical protein [Chloroflexota bacterium]